jgi:hypothetical protein
MLLSDVAAQIRELRREKANLTDQLKAIDTSLQTLEKDLIDFMAAQGLNKVTSEGLTMSLRVQEIPAVEDWDKLYAYVYANKSGHLFQRRLTAANAKELRDSGVDVPGIRWIEEPRVTYTSVKS